MHVQISHHTCIKHCFEDYKTTFNYVLNEGQDKTAKIITLCISMFNKTFLFTIHVSILSIYYFLISVHNYMFSCKNIQVRKKNELSLSHSLQHPYGAMLTLLVHLAIFLMFFL